MSKKRRQKKAQRLASRLRDVGQFETAQRLVEAFSLDKAFSVGTPEVAPDDAMADIDDEVVTESLGELERYIPVEAAFPDDLEEEQSLVFDTDVCEVSGK